MAYVLGFIYADGAVEDCRKSSRTCYLSLANNDLDLLKDISRAISTQQTIHVRDQRTMKIGGKEYLCKTSYVVRIGNKIIYDDLMKLGLCPRKSLIIELPEVPDEYFSYFLRGYFDGDGCINVEKTKNNRLNIIFTSGSEVFLEQMANKIQELFPTIKSSIAFGCGAFRLRYNWRNAQKIAGFIYEDIIRAPYLKYKYEKYLEFLNRRELNNEGCF